MRIVVANSFHYRRGGDSSQFLDLVATLEDRGHAVATFSMHHPQNLPSVWSTYWAPYVEYRGDLTVRDRLHAGWRSIYSQDAKNRMSRLLEDFQPEVVHFHSVQNHLTMAAVDACYSAATPVVWTLHDYRSVCPASALLRSGCICERCAGGSYWHGIVGRCKSGELSRSLAAVAESYITRARRTLAEVDCYVAPSRFLAHKVLEMGLPARRLEVVPNPAGRQAASVDSSSRHGLLYVGRLSAEKGVDCLIKAVAGLPGVPLSIVGDGPAAAHSKAIAANFCADVTFDGWLDSAAVGAKMAEAELLCVPSVWYENCPGVLLEAMAAGLPVVASRLGGLTELLAGGRVGWLAEAGDPDEWRRVIHEALVNRERTAELAARAVTRVRARHDPDVFAERIEAIYRSVARGDSKGAVGVR